MTVTSAQAARLGLGLLTCPEIWDLSCCRLQTGWSSSLGFLCHRPPILSNPLRSTFPLTQCNFKCREPWEMAASHVRLPSLRKAYWFTSTWSLIFQSSQGLRSPTYLLFSLLSTPPFPPGSYEIVCKCSTSFLTCYLCKTSSGWKSPWPSTEARFLPGVFPRGNYRRDFWRKQIYRATPAQF